MNGNTSSENLKRLEERYESFALSAGSIVVIGLIVEVVLAFEFAHGETLLEIWSPVVADILVAFGVFGEILFARKAKSISEKLQRQSEEKVGDATVRAAEANERAEQAKLETQHLRALLAWRRLDDKQHIGLALNLRNSGKGSFVKFCVVMNDQESLNFAQLISMPFVASGWTVGFSFNSYPHGIMTGIFLPEPQDNWLDEMKDVNGRVRDSFIAAEIPFVNGWPLDPYIQSEDTAMLAWPHAWIYVGPKPPPRL